MIKNINKKFILSFFIINLIIWNICSRVEADSNDNFKVDSPFWKSTEAICLYVLLAIIIILIVICININRVNTLDAMVSKRTYELNEEMKKNTELLNKVIDLEKRKNTYLVNISHELRTPLNVLNSIQQLIRELNKGPEGISKDKIDHYMEISEKNIHRLLKIINDLIDTSKVEHGNYNINIQKNDIVYIVEETALSLKDYIENKNIELIIDPEIEEKIIECDANEIERCVINLVSNAAKFTHSGGSILISVKDLKDKVKIEVSDTGIGIEEKYLDNIFDRFNQIIDSNCEIKGGSGLGLTITKNIVKLHNGEIYVESKINKGSKFTIILPVKQKL